jgi:diacylglycerol kinase family enzyme
MSEIIVNPHAGNGHALGAAREIQAKLRHRGHEARVHVFESPAAAKQWAHTCRHGFTHLFCLGGDGTLSTVAAAAVRHRVPLVPVPFGFGNLFGRTFGHSADPTHAVGMLDDGVVQWADAGRGADGLFLCHRSFGVIERVQQMVEVSRALPASRLRRALSYLRTALRAFSVVRLPKIRVEVDGERISDSAAIVTVANVPTYRGVLELTPDASPFDGLLDIAVVPRAPARRLFAMLVVFALRLPGRWDHVVRVRGRRAAVEVRGHREELTLLPHALPVLTPSVGMGGVLYAAGSESGSARVRERRPSGAPKRPSRSRRGARAGRRRDSRRVKPD